MSQHRFIRETLYALKREYGVVVDLYAAVSTTTDLETGRREQEKRSFRIKRAILLPKRVYADVVKLLRGSGGAPVHHGAALDKIFRLIIVDARDYPEDYSPDPEDYLVIGEGRYNVREVEEYEHRLAVLLKVEQVVGELPMRVTVADAKSEVDLQSNGRGET